MPIARSWQLDLAQAAASDARSATLATLVLRPVLQPDESLEAFTRAAVARAGYGFVVEVSDALSRIDAITTDAERANVADGAELATLICAKLTGVRGQWLGVGGETKLSIALVCEWNARVALGRRVADGTIVELLEGRRQLTAHALAS